MVACVSTLVGIALAVRVVGGVDHRVGEELPAALAAAVSLLVAKGTLDKLLSGDKSANTTVGTSAGAAVAAGALCAVAWRAVTAPIADLVGPELVGLSNLETVFFVVGLLCVTPVVSAIAVLASTAVLGLLKPQFVARSTLGAAALMSITLFGMVVLALVRIPTRPSIDCYLEDSLRSAVEIHMSGVDDSGAGPGGFKTNGEATSPVLPPVREHRDSVGDVTIVQVCDGWDACDVGVVDGLDAKGSDDPSPLNDHRVRLLKGHASLVVVRMAPDLMLVKASVRRTYAWPADDVSNIVFRRIENRWREERFQLEWIIRRTNLPLAWIDFGLAGVGLMLVLWTFRVLVPPVHRRAHARAQSEMGVGRLLSAYRFMFAEPGNEFLVTEYSLMRVDAAIVAVTCITASPLVTAAVMGLLR